MIVGGKLRGREFELKEGENIVGRDEDCDIHLPVGGVSGRHASITVTEDVCYLVDLESSNGTLVNDSLIQKATIKNGDKIAFPHTIFHIAFVKVKKIVIKKKMLEGEADRETYLHGGTPPTTLPLKLLWIFKYRIMKFIYGINEEYEWRVLIGILLFIFVVLTVTATVFPVLRDSRIILLNEVAVRGAHYADEIVRMNSTALKSNELEKLDTEFLDREKSVKEYRLYDLEGRVIRPNELMNQYISKPFFVQVKNFYEKNRYKDKLYLKRLPNNIIGVGKIIQAYNPQTGRNQPLGIIALKFSPTSLQIEKTFKQKAYAESLITTILVAIIFFLIICYLTQRHLEELKFQLEEAMAGNRKELESRWLMDEIVPLRNTLNTLLQKWRELNNEESEDFAEEESDVEYVELLREFMKGSGVPTIVLDSNKNTAFINASAEDLTGIRESSSQGSNLLDVAREKGFAATVVELCDYSANNSGANAQGEYELGGNEYTVHVSSLIGKDRFAKAFYITFLQEND